jgi:hypothetical protein
MALIHNYYSKIEQLYIEKFGAFKYENKKVSICIYKWTSCRNRKCMNIRVYYNETSFNVGFLL